MKGGASIWTGSCNLRAASHNLEAWTWPLRNGSWDSIPVSDIFQSCNQNTWGNNLKRGKMFFWFMVSQVSVHHGREGVAKQSSSHHGGQEAEEGDYRKGQCKIQPPRTHPQWPVSSTEAPPPTPPHLPIMPCYHNSIHGLITQDPITYRIPSSEVTESWPLECFLSASGELFRQGWGQSTYKDRQPGWQWAMERFA
jgi:hypothetical protein